MAYESRVMICWTDITCIRGNQGEHHNYCLLCHVLPNSRVHDKPLLREVTTPHLHPIIPIHIVRAASHATVCVQVRVIHSVCATERWDRPAAQRRPWSSDDAVIEHGRGRWCFQPKLRSRIGEFDDIKATVWGTKSDVLPDVCPRFSSRIKIRCSDASISQFQTWSSAYFRIQGTVPQS
ncbi:uncharacterized protein K444DRAFT_267461 [Hyaloscypha bicolor E]|uniref:Uncharacterized protein n=1 Tax=Hyaloscypha bicolor E TaxID=1095630 RepID=A0A2J6SI04_9HELO|nr:uncharacterized protein K444DRAFT_267461 [Hyaloscypha bicolor E]PMD50391.1 hypothetical protein K444DRAFT_267461 [Hyaloscypha bicolor E]